VIKPSQIFDFLVPRFFLNLGGGGGGSTTSTVTQSNVPDWLRPQVEGMLSGAMGQLFNVSQTGIDEEGQPTYTVGGPKPFVPYSQAEYSRLGMPSGAETVAGYDPYKIQLGGQMQQQALNTGNWLGSPAGQQFMNEQFGRAGDFATEAGYGGMNAAAQAMGYTDPATGKFVPGFGQIGQQAGALGQQLGVGEGGRLGGMGAGYGGAAAGLAPRAAGLGGLYEQMATTPGEYQKYMSPYMQEVVARQQSDAATQAKIMEQGRKAAAARAGAFGGSRRFIEQAEADKALGSQLGNIQAQGLQKAFDQAQQNINQRAQLESQGLGQAGQLYGVGIQGAQTGLQGLQQQLAGTAQGMQGAGMGLQGVQTGLGGYNLMGQQGRNLADITSQRLKDLMGTSQFGYTLGEQQRQLAQQAINQQIQNFAMAQETPYNRFTQLNALIRGYAVPGQTVSQYTPPASAGSQLASAGLGIYGMNQLFGGGKKAGGVVEGGDGIDRLALRKALAGELK
jgi:hypothetical protein